MNQLVEKEGAYVFASYVGLDCHSVRQQFQGEGNPFDHCVVVIDEVHLVVDLLSANMNNTASPYPTLYEWLLDAENCRVIALSGTPRVSKLTDLGVMYNLLYGYIKVWQVAGAKTVESADLKRRIHQQVPKGKTLEVTRTPYGFEAEYDENGRLTGLLKVETGWDDHKFKSELSKHGTVSEKVEKHKLLPDKGADFVDEETFQKRTQGLTSFFPSLDHLLPPLNREQAHFVDLSDFQAKESTVHNVQFPKEVPRVKREVDACGGLTGYEENVFKTLAHLKEKQVFQNLDKFSPKLKTLVETVSKKETRQFVFCKLFEEAVFLGEALEGAGYTKVELNAPNPPEQPQWTVSERPGEKNKNKNKNKKYVLYCGGQEEKELLLKTFNSGGSVVFIASGDATDGISLVDVTDVHMLQPSTDPSEMAQIVGRARRMCKNTTDEAVTPHVYVAGKAEKEVYQGLEEKRREAEHWLSLIKETAVDCSLHQKKCFAPTKSKSYPTQQGKTMVFEAQPFEEEGMRWTPLYENETDTVPIGFKVLDKDDENEIGEPAYFDPEKKPVAGLDALLNRPTSTNTTKIKIKIKIKVGQNGKSKEVYVFGLTGEQAVYKDEENLIGYVQFGPPRVFLNVKKEVVADFDDFF